MNTLFDLYKNHVGKVSDKWTLYLSAYDTIFSSYLAEPISMLEIGVQNGGSLEIWAKYFRESSVFIGCDINQDCKRLIYDNPNINLLVGDATQDALYSKIKNISNSLDIVIDDGSHTSTDIIKAFALYFPLIKDGGLFVAEDLHCSYWESFEGGLFYPYSSISFFKKLADIVNYQHWFTSKSRAELLKGFFDKYDILILEDDLAQIHSIEFINSMCVVRKKPATSNDIGTRYISGSDEMIVQGHTKLHMQPYSLFPQVQQEGNFWSSLSSAPEESYLAIKAELEMTTAELGLAEEKITFTQEYIDLIEGSWSWKVTKPLRYIKSYFNKMVNCMRVKVRK